VSKGLKQASCTLINLEVLNQETTKIEGKIRQEFNKLHSDIKSEISQAANGYNTS